jgi:hypothetical protein
LINLGLLRIFFEKQNFKFKTLSRVGENVYLTMNQEKLARSDIWFDSYEPLQDSTVIEEKRAKIGCLA